MHHSGGDVNNEGDCAYVGAEGNGKCLYLPFNFAVNLKLLLKNKVWFKKKIANWHMFYNISVCD